MPKKALRQGLQVSVKELKELTDELLEEALEAYAEIGIANPKILEKKWLISIINKQPECSDTWEIYKGRIAKVSKVNKKFLEATSRLIARKKKITPEQVNDLIQEVGYGEKK